MSKLNLMYTNLVMFSFSLMITGFIFLFFRLLNFVNIWNNKEILIVTTIIWANMQVVYFYIKNNIDTEKDN